MCFDFTGFTKDNMNARRETYLIFVIILRSRLEQIEGEI
jgi:hypothetical protein